MKAGFVVSLAAALALMIFAPTGASAVGVGKTCGGFPGLQCDAGLFCQKKAGTCGVIDMAGKCVPVPAACPRHSHHILPVCGCNNVTYNNDCERQQAMVSKNHDGKCN
jgi:hypothetical protein